ncbi:hypothetical protein ACHAW5_010202 [Stephanodiscus triporus]|uniref:DDE Tnp4 domain-containing protein n=1 Tax=Stephanodiscus triporus TaxID=2934178 RepID=A0ABD3NEE7_9STRA
MRFRPSLLSLLAVFKERKGNLLKISPVLSVSAAAEVLYHGIKDAARVLRRYKKKGLKTDSNTPPPIPNGRISTSVRLACALRYFAGGSPYDIMSVYGVSHTIILDSVWCVVEATNQVADFYIEYPKSCFEQKKIAKGFEEKSDVGFSNCAGCVDGLLIWTHKPTEKDAEMSGVGQKKFLCGRKSKFGLNCQAISDVRGRILDISIVYGGASSDCLAFEGSDIFQKLELGLLHDDLVLFGDNAYLNSKFMVTPYPNVSSGSKDDFNFFHSQLRIRVECAFGMLVGRWGLLRAAIPQNISLTRTIALVHALAKLHNFCIDMHDKMHSKEPASGDIPERLQEDEDYMVTHSPEGYITMTTTDVSGVSLPSGLMDCGHHSDDMPRALRRTRSILNDIEESCPTSQPRELLHLQVIESQLTRPHENQINHK